MNFFIKKIAFALIIFLVVLFIYGYWCDWFFTSSTYLDHVANKRAWSLKKKGEHFNWAILGSSRAFGSFDMNLLSELAQKRIINLGANGSGYLDNYLTLYLFLKNQNTIDTLFIQADMASLNSKISFSNAFHIYNFLPYWQDEVIQQTLSENISYSEKLIWTYLPSVRYLEYNKYFSPKEVVRRIQESMKPSPYDLSSGGPIDKNSEPFQASKKTITETRTIDPEDLRMLNKIVTLCHENNIPIIAYRAPELKSHKEHILNYDKLDKKIVSIFTEMNIRFIQPDPGIETETGNFKDPGHLNGNGRNLFTRMFADSLLLQNTSDR